MKRITIVITTYNGALFIEEQLDSLLGQSVSPDEVLIFDDGSKDDTCSIVETYIEKNELREKWKLIKNVQNKGYARNFVEGAMQAQGLYIFLCDQDDIWMPDKLEVMANILDQNEDINLLCSNLEPFYYDEDTRKWDPKVLESMKNDGSIDRYNLTSSGFHIQRSGCTMCLRNSFLHSIYKYWRADWPHDDFFWKMAAMTGSCAIVQYTSIKRRMHRNNTSVLRTRTRQWRISQLKERHTYYQPLMQYANDVNASKAVKETIQKNLDSIQLRIDLLEKKYILNIIKLITRYKDCYPRKKGLYLDIYLAFRDKYEGAN